MGWLSRVTAGGSGSVIRAQPGEVYRQNLRVSETDEVDDVAVSRFVAMGAYGEVMLRFQLLEMSYWSILAARKPSAMSLDQHIAKLTEWDRQTGERLINALGLPDDLHGGAMIAVNTRNLLAHRFLRERAVSFGDPRASHEAARVLAEVEAKIDESRSDWTPTCAGWASRSWTRPRSRRWGWRSRRTSRRGRRCLRGRVGVYMVEIAASGADPFPASQRREPGRSIRRAVGVPDGPRSHSWSLFGSTNDNDVYLSPRS